MTKSNTDKVWLLKLIEYEGQCTGFSHFVTLLGVFSEKPNMTEIAGMMSVLPKDMGEAIEVVSKLIDTGNADVYGGSYSYEIEEVEVGVRLDNE